MSTAVAPQRPAPDRPARARASRPPDARPPSQPDPRRLAEVIARLFLEIEQGRRALPQLERLMAPDLYARLRRTLRPRHPARGPRHATVTVLSVHGSLTRHDVYDAVAVVRRGGRAGSLTMRLERSAGTWRLQELGRPEDHGTTYERPPMVALR